jgi:CDP-2,3-bis-(O-geranylgeranyl)-sn-glycerol synthase
LGLPPSSQAIGLDQIPESLFPLIAARLLLPLGALDIAIATMLFFAGGMYATGPISGPADDAG